MDNNDFIEICKLTVLNYANNIDGDPITIDDIYVVWLCKTLQNNKALLSSTRPDSRYYECTYNGNKNELYFDAYKKEVNICIPLEGKVGDGKCNL